MEASLLVAPNPPPMLRTIFFSARRGGSGRRCLVVAAATTGKELSTTRLSERGNDAGEVRQGVSAGKVMTGGARGVLLAAAAAAAVETSSTLALPGHAWASASASDDKRMVLFRAAAVVGELDPATAKTVAGVAGPALSALGFLFILRIVMSWYPRLPVTEFPYVVAYAPTEPLLAVTRKLIPPLGGVDVTPVVWFGLVSFLSEILVGPQGLLVLLSQQQS